MWAHGLDDRPATLTFEPPAGTRWQVATQLHPGATPFEFTAPNLAVPDGQPGRVRAGRDPRVLGRTTARFRFVAASHGHRRRARRLRQGRREDRAAGRRDLRRVPGYEPGYYTFLADYLPYANGDGMEHRNSTVMTAAGLDRARSRCGSSTPSRTSSSTAGTSSASGRGGSSRSTSIARTCRTSCGSPRASRRYYGPLVLQRAPVWPSCRRRRRHARRGSSTRSRISSGRAVRSAVEMSRMAPFIDGGRTIDRTDWSNTVISYYPFGGGDRAGARSLAARSLGRPADARRLHAGDVARVTGSRAGRARGTSTIRTSIADAEATLAEVSGDRGVRARLLRALRRRARRRGLRAAARARRADGPPAAAGRGVVGRRADWTSAPAGRARRRRSCRSAHPRTPPGSSRTTRCAGGRDVDRIERRSRRGLRAAQTGRSGVGRVRRPDRAPRRRRRSPSPRIRHVEVVPAETAGRSLTPAQRAFRDGWLNPRP